MKASQRKTRREALSVSKRGLLRLFEGFFNSNRAGDRRADHVVVAQSDVLSLLVFLYLYLCKMLDKLKMI